MPKDTVLQKSKYLNAVTWDMSWFSHLRASRGEDGYYTDKILADIVSSIKAKYPDCAITLSLVKKVMKAINCFMRLERTDTFFAMKQQMPSTTQASSACYVLKTENNVFTISKK